MLMLKSIYIFIGYWFFIAGFTYAMDSSDPLSENINYVLENVHKYHVDPSEPHVADILDRMRNGSGENREMAFKEFFLIDLKNQNNPDQPILFMEYLIAHFDLRDLCLLALAWCSVIGIESAHGFLDLPPEVVENAAGLVLGFLVIIFGESRYGAFMSCAALTGLSSIALEIIKKKMSCSSILNGPYCPEMDNINRNLPDWYKKQFLPLNQFCLERHRSCYPNGKLPIEQ